MAKEKMDSNNLLNEALAAYKIDPQCVFSSRMDEENGEIIILTNGGSRVHFKTGDQVEPLDPIAVTGINPVKRKPITGPSAKK